MADFTRTLTQFLQIKCNPLRADGTPGTVPTPLTFTTDNSAVATVSSEAADQCRVISVAAGTCNITATGRDENNNIVSSSFSVAIVNDPNPTTHYTFTQLNP